MAQVLVTGATGFVGKRLCQMLGAAGFDVKACVRHQQEDFPFPQILIPSIDQTTDWQDALEEVDYVIHCAARVHVMQDSVSDPLSEYRKVNVEGTKTLLEASQKAGVKRFIFLSSIKVNGEDTENRPAFKSDDVINADALDPYGLSKFEAEEVVKGLCHAEDRLSYTIIRPPLVYGEGVKANFAQLIRLSQKKLPVPFGCLKNKRSLVYRDNLCDLIITCLDHENARNETFLASDDRDLPVRDLYKTLCHLQQKKALMVFVAPFFLRLLGKLLGRTAQVKRLCQPLCVDIQKTKERLNWIPPVDIYSGLFQTLKGRQ